MSNFKFLILIESSSDEMNHIVNMNFPENELKRVRWLKNRDVTFLHIFSKCQYN